MRFTVTEIITKYLKVGDDYQYIDVSKDYVVNNWDDLQNLLMMLVDFSDGKVKVEVRKEVIDEQ